MEAGASIVTLIEVRTPPKTQPRLADSELIDPKQFEFSMNDEIKAVARLASYRCPLCRAVPVLFRTFDKTTGQPLFQVVCSNSRGFPMFRDCHQPSIPPTPIADSRGAVRAWSLALSLSK